VTDTTPLPEGILAGVALAIVDAFAKFKEHACSAWLYPKKLR